MSYTYLSQNIRHLRKIYRISQLVLSVSIEVKKQDVGKWERRIKEPTISDLIQVALYFGVTIDDLCAFDFKQKKTKIVSFSNNNNEWFIGPIMGRQILKAQEKTIKKLAAQLQKQSKRIDDLELEHKHIMQTKFKILRVEGNRKYIL